MSEQYWIGTQQAIGDELALGNVAPDSFRVAPRGVTLQTREGVRWLGIEPPPSDSFILEAPEEASGEARWVEYPSWHAPECDLTLMIVTRLMHTRAPWHPGNIDCCRECTLALRRHGYVAWPCAGKTEREDARDLRSARERFGLDNGNRHSLDDVAAELGIDPDAP